MTYAAINAPHTRKRRSGAHLAMSKCAAPEHKRAARIIGYALTLGDLDAWFGTAVVLCANLTPVERAAIAWAAMRSLDACDADQVARHYLLGAGMPVPTFDEAKDEAALWAAAAAPRELRAYAGAAFKGMSPADRATFLEWVRRAR